MIFFSPLLTQNYQITESVSLDPKISNTDKKLTPKYRMDIPLCLMSECSPWEFHIGLCSHLMMGSRHSNKNFADNKRTSESHSLSLQSYIGLVRTPSDQ